MHARRHVCDSARLPGCETGTTARAPRARAIFVMATGSRGLSDDPADGEFVVPVEATRDLETVPALIAWVAPQTISGLVKALDEQRQTELAHLRRVHRTLASPPPPDGVSGQLAVLLCLGGPKAFDSLPASARRVLQCCGAQPLVVHVPKHAPQLRWQFETWTRVWPLHFHEGAAARSLAVWLGKQPSADELRSMHEHMRRAIGLAHRAAASGGRAVAAVFVRSAQVVAEAVDCTASPAAASSASPASSCVHAHAHPLGHAVLRGIEQVASAERQHKERKRLQTAAAAGGDDSTGVQAPDTSGKAEAALAVSGDDVVDHLCNECDVYLTLEPCAMCTMAMVHSRVRRVIYAVPAGGGGALGSKYCLHTERSLNHHFQVVRGMLMHEAAGLCDAATVSVGG